MEGDEAICQVHKQGMTVLLADKVHELEPQRKWLRFTQPSTCPEKQPFHHKIGT